MLDERFNKRRIWELAESMPTPLMVVEVKTRRCAYANKPWFELLNYDWPKLFMLELSQLFLDREAFSQFWQRLKQERAFHNYEFEITTTPEVDIVDEDNILMVQISAKLTTLQGEDYALIGFQDITKQNILRDELEGAKLVLEQMNRIKTEFLAGISHEFRTPLNAIIGFSEIIRSQSFGVIPNPKYADYAALIHKSGLHLLNIVQDVLDLSKIERGTVVLKEENLDLNQLIISVVDMFQKDIAHNHIQFRKELLMPAPHICADSSLLKKILINILSNAIKCTPQNGTIHLVCVLNALGELCITIKDTGIGMSEAELQRALLPFGQVTNPFMRKNQGTGLGLPLAKSYMEQHGGSLVITSAPNEGTIVEMILPKSRIICNQQYSFAI